MIRHQHTVYIARPLEQVFAYLADSRHLPDWQSSLIAIEQLTEGPLRVGSRFREVRQMGPRRSEVQAEITRFDPVRGQFGTRTLTQPEVTVTYSLEREGSGTRLSYEFGMLTGGMARIMEPLIAASIKKGTSADMQKLKQLLESAAAWPATGQLHPG